MNETNQLERVRYWEGQLLASGDLQTQLRVAGELRRLHNRALHNSHGIAIGLTVGEIQNDAVALSCGLAYDCSGRELIVPVAIEVLLPAKAITLPTLLTLTWEPAAGGAALSWHPQGAPVQGGSVALARLLPKAGGAELDPDFRPVISRPLARPQLANGITVPGNTAWEVWQQGDESIGVQTTVDTSTAGFTSTPNYFAELITDNPKNDFLPAWFTSIGDAAPGSFTFRLFMRRITREPFDILDPITRVASTPAPAGKGTVNLVSGNVLTKYEVVSRLLPVAATASVVTALSGKTATLDNPIDGLTAAADVAFGNPPRLATVMKVGPATGFAVTVDKPENFQVDNVVVKLGPAFASARPTTVSSIDDDGILELANPINGLAIGDDLGVAQAGSVVTGVTATTVTVQNPALFTQNGTVVCIDNQVEDFPPAMVTNINGADLTLSLPPAAIAALNGLHIAPVQLAGTVENAASEVGEVIVQVDSSKVFRTGDMIAKLLPGGAFSEPVRVQSVHSGAKPSLTLSKKISGLTILDHVGAADWRARATVQSVSNGGDTVTVANASVFPTGSFVVHLNDGYTAVASAAATSGPGNTLTLNPPMVTLKAGDILALCSMPVTVSVESINPDGSIQIDTPDLIKPGDVVAALPVHRGIAIVAAAGGLLIQLASPIAGLTGGDLLSVVTVGGVVNATPGPGAGKVTLEAGHRVRMGDFLAPVMGWREPGPIRSTAFVTDSTGTVITLYTPVDGLMAGDVIGLASLKGPGSFIPLCLKELPADLIPGDEVLLVGLDRLTGATTSLFANVVVVISEEKLVFLYPGAASTTAAFTIRPADISASRLFLRGSPLALVRNQNLYVSWLACQNPEAMPRPCPDSTASDGPCGKTAQS